MLLYLVFPGIIVKKTYAWDVYIKHKIVLKKVRNQHVSNGRTDFLVTIIVLLRFLNRT